jgi:hypothetical protein
LTTRSATPPFGPDATETFGERSVPSQTDRSH